MSSVNSNNDKNDLLIADKDQLQNLPGKRPVKADTIIQCRERDTLTLDNLCRYTGIPVVTWKCWEWIGKTEILSETPPDMDKHSNNIATDRDREMWEMYKRMMEMMEK